jgi:hypothetical protein
MEDKDNMTEQEEVQFVSDKIAYEFTSEILAKPLEEIRVERTTIEPFNQFADTASISGKKPKEKKRPVEDNDLPEGMHRVTREGLSMQQHAIILKLPINKLPEHLQHLQVGNVVVYEMRSVRPFELFKDSIIIPPHAVLAIYTNTSKLLISTSI